MEAAGAGIMEAGEADIMEAGAVATAAGADTDVVCPSELDMDIRDMESVIRTMVGEFPATVTILVMARGGADIIAPIAIPAIMEAMESAMA